MESHNYDVIVVSCSPSTGIEWHALHLSLWLIGTVRAEPGTVISRASVQSPEGTLKMREWKHRHGTECRGGKCRSGKIGTVQQGWKMREWKHRHGSAEVENAGVETSGKRLDQ